MRPTLENNWRARALQHLSTCYFLIFPQIPACDCKIRRWQSKNSNPHLRDTAIRGNGIILYLAVAAELPEIEMNSERATAIHSRWKIAYSDKSPGWSCLSWMTRILLPTIINHSCLMSALSANSVMYTRRRNQSKISRQPVTKRKFSSLLVGSASVYWMSESSSIKQDFQCIDIVICIGRQKFTNRIMRRE